MASGTNSMSVQSQNNNQYTYSLSVNYSSGEQSIASNSTTVNLSCTLDGQYIGWSGTNVTCYLYWHDSVNGDQLVTQGTWTSGGYGQGGARSLSASKIVKHSSDGSLSDCYAWVRLESATNDYAPKSVTSLITNGDRTLPTIPVRATTLKISSESANLDSSITLTGTASSSNFTHKLYVVWNGSKSAISESLGSTISVSYKLPKNWANNLVTTNKGTCTFVLETYSGTAKIGSSEKNLSVQVPSNNTFGPIVKSLTITDASSEITEKFGAYVQDQSKLSVTIEAESYYGATISDVRTAIDGVYYKGSEFTTAVLASESAQFGTEITDSRGNQTVKLNGYSALPYSNPTISIGCQRCDSSYAVDAQGTYGLLNYNYSISELDSKNDVYVTFEYRESGATDWTTIATITSGFSGDSTIQCGSIFEADKNYDVRCGIKDYFTSLSYVTILVSATDTLINFGANGSSIALFGQARDKEKVLDINGEAFVSIDGTLTSINDLFARVKALEDKGGAKATVLFDGSESGTVTLTDDVANYDYIDVIWTVEGAVQTERIYAPNGKQSVLSLIEFRSGTTSYTWYYSKRIQIVSTQIRVRWYKKYRIQDSTSWLPYGYDTNDIYILKVIGYKE